MTFVPQQLPRGSIVTCPECHAEFSVEAAFKAHRCSPDPGDNVRRGSETLILPADGERT
jgi:hypothetical protein